MSSESAAAAGDGALDHNMDMPPGVKPSTPIPVDANGKVVGRRERARLKKEAAEPKLTKKEMIAKMKQEREVEDKIEKERRKTESVGKMRLQWQTACFAASNFKDGGELNMSWTPLIVVDTIIYKFQDDFGGLPLIALRLVGCELTHLPDDFGKHLKTLRTLSIPSNHLTALPDSLCEMTNLREMNLLNNKLEKLPDRIGFLCSLESLLVANNCIKSLPNSFGALNLLTRIDLECNQIKLLPENLDNMTNLQCFNCNRNQLVRLPHCLARMPSLTSISAAFNKIQYIPLDLVENKGIKVLRVSNNLIVNIPDQIGKMKKLKELALDYNNITKLPLSFHKLTKLQNLRVEGNPKLNDPPEEILAKGAVRVVQYCAELYHEREVGRMKEIIRAVQDCLFQVEERKIYDPSLFEPRVIPSDSSDEFFAVQLDYLWNDLIPSLQRLWHQEGLEGIVPNGRINVFPFTEDDVFWAFTGFADAYGLCLRKEKAMFKRCSCVDNNGRKTPCVPPKVGFMCLRMCTLFKAKIVQKREKDERLWIEYKRNGVNDAIKRAKHEAELYLKSEEGHLWVEKNAYDKAEELTMEGAVEKAVLNRLGEANEKKKKIISKFDKKKAKVQKVRDKKAGALEVEIHKLKLEEASCREGYMKNSITMRINELMTNLARMEETVMLERLQAECDEECKKIDAALYADAETSSESDFELDSDDLPDTDDESEEAQKKRAFFKKKQREQHLYEKFNHKEPHPIVEIINEFSDTVVTTFGGTVKTKRIMHALEYKDYKEFKEIKKRDDTRKWRRFNKTLKSVKEVASIRMKKLFNKLGGEFDEVQKEMSHEIKFQYIQYQVQIAKEKAENEFAVIDSVRMQWGGLGVQASFKAWAKYIKEKKSRIRKDMRNEYRTKTKALETVMESVRLARVQVALWEKYTDIYTDIPFWKHKHHSGITNTEPGIQHFLPPQFYIPEPPKPLPPDCPYFTTSEEEEEDDPLDTPITKKKKQQQRKATAVRKLKRKDQAERMKAAKEAKERRDDKANSDDGEKEYAFGYIPENLDPFSPRFSTPRKWGALAIPEAKPEIASDTAAAAAAAGSTSDLQIQYSDPNGYNYYGNGTEGYDQNYYYDSTQGYDSTPGEHNYNYNYNYNYNDGSSYNVSGYNDAQCLDGGYSGDVDQDLDQDPTHSQALLSIAMGSSRPTDRSGANVDAGIGVGVGVGVGGVGGGRGSIAGGATSAGVWFGLAAATNGDILVGTEASAPKEGVGVGVGGGPGVGSSVASSETESKDKMPPIFSYGPDSLRYNKSGRANKVAYHQEERIPKALAKKLAYAQYTNLFEKVEEADRFMNSKDYVTDRVSFDNLVASDMKHNAQVVKNIQAKEYDKAEAIIRRLRGKFNPSRMKCYENQLALRFTKVEEEEEKFVISTKDKATDSMLDTLMKENKGSDISTLIRNQNPVDLLRLVGGTVDMLHVEGKDGFRLRSLLAARALIIRDRLIERAVERKLIKPQDPSFYDKHFAPFWLEGLPSSDEEDDGKGEKKESFAKKKRREERESRKIMEDKLNTGNILK